jgi:hypothetical protein
MLSALKVAGHGVLGNIFGTEYARECSFGEAVVLHACVLHVPPHRPRQVLSGSGDSRATAAGSLTTSAAWENN